jgi:hypothetical protein
MKSIFDKAGKTAEELLERAKDGIITFFQNRSTYDDAGQVHGFYRLQNPSGRFLGYRHHCPVSGDYEVSRGSVVVHCPDRKREVFNPDAAMPTVIKHPAPRKGVATLPDGSRLVDTTVGEFNGEYGYEPYDPGAGSNWR